MMEELERGGLAGDELDSLQKLYAEVKVEEAREREQREGNAGGTASEAGVLKLGGLAHGVLSRLLTTLKLMTDVGPPVYYLLCTGNPKLPAFLVQGTKQIGFVMCLKPDYLHNSPFWSTSSLFFSNADLS